MRDAKVEPRALSAAGPFVAKTVDEVLLKINGFGLYQSLAVLYWILLVGAGGMVSLSFILLGREQPVSCPQKPSNAFKECTDGNVCDFPYQFPGNGTFSYSASFDLVCAHKHLFPVPTMLYFLGFASGAWYFGGLTDRIGRRPVLVYSSGFAILGHVFMCLCSPGEFFQFCVIRAFIGVCFGGQMASSWNILMEQIGPAYRALVTGIAWAGWSVMCLGTPFIGFNVDSYFQKHNLTLWAWSSYFPAIRAWQATGLLIALPMFLVLFLLSPILLHESPRFLLSVGRKEEAMKQLSRIAKVNGMELPKCDLAEMPQKVKGHERGTKVLFSNWKVARVTVFSVYLWFATTLSYYGLSLVLTSVGSDVYTSMAYSSLMEIPAYLSTGYVLKYYGRRAVMVATMAQGGLFCLIFAFFGSTAKTSPLLQTIAFTSKFGITLAHCVIYVYTSELFPTDSRGSAMGLSNVGARIGGLISTPILHLSTFGPDTPIIVFGLVSLIGTLLLLCLPETKNRKTLETIEDMVKENGTRNTSDGDKDV